MLFDSRSPISKVRILRKEKSKCFFFLFRLARRLEREVKEILDDFSSDETLKASLIKGKRVDLAEELSTNTICWLLNSLCFVCLRTCSTYSRKIRRIYRSFKQRKIVEFVNLLPFDHSKRKNKPNKIFFFFFYAFKIDCFRA